MPDIRHEIFIASDAQTIYEALTLQKGLSAWWTPDTVAVPEVNSIARFAFANGYYKEMQIEVLKPSETVIWTCISGATEWIGTSIAFNLQSGTREILLQTHAELHDQLGQSTSSSGTLVIFSHENWKEYSAMFAECNYTWALFLRSLKLFCETGKGRPWPMQHQ